MNDIKQIAERVLALDAEATEGPWSRATSESEDGAEMSACGPEHNITFASDDEDDDELREREMALVEADAALIADYRTSAPALAREVLRLTEEVARLREVLGLLTTFVGEAREQADRAGATRVIVILNKVQRSIRKALTTGADRG